VDATDDGIGEILFLDRLEARLGSVIERRFRLSDEVLARIEAPPDSTPGETT
jgi:hypothetical protein